MEGAQGTELSPFIWIALAIILGLVTGWISFQLKKKTLASKELLREARERDAVKGHDNYHTTEDVMERAVRKDHLPIDSIEN